MTVGMLITDQAIKVSSDLKQLTEYNLQFPTRIATRLKILPNEYLISTIAGTMKT